MSNKKLRQLAIAGGLLLLVIIGLFLAFTFLVAIPRFREVGRTNRVRAFYQLSPSLTESKSRNIV